MKKENNKKNKNDKIISVYQKSANKEVTLNWRGKIIPASKALSPLEKKGRRNFIFKIILFLTSVALFLSFIWFFVQGIPQIVGAFPDENTTFIMGED